MQRPFTVLFAVALTFAAAVFFLCCSAEADESQKQPDIKAAVGQNLVVGIPGASLDGATRDILRELRPAGIILYAWNIKSLEQTEALIGELQKLAVETTGLPYLIMIDEEPGGATRLNFFKNVFSTGEPDWKAIERDIKKMASMGINVNLAPVADFPFDKDSFIKKRIAARTPGALKSFNRRFISISQRHGVAATLKHFPGLGVFTTDPHRKLPHAAAKQTALDDSIGIFKHGIDSGAMFVMTGHAIYDDLDPGLTATVSKKITTELLKDSLGFRGIVMTDDLSDMPVMPGSKKRNVLAASKKALLAGNNYLLFSHHPEHTLKTAAKLIETAEKDTAIKNAVEENYRVSVELKKKFLFGDKKSGNKTAPAR